MSRRGISLSMSYVVIGLILVTVAVFVIASVRGGIDLLEGVTEGQISESEKDLIRNQCLAGKSTECEKDDVTGTQWAENVHYDGQPCSEWHSQNNIFEGGGIPAC